MDFQQASARFQWLESQLRSGTINEQQYRVGLNELRVTDAGGRLWMPQEHSGAWFVFQNGQWLAAQPPVPLTTSFTRADIRADTQVGPYGVSAAGLVATVPVQGSLVGKYLRYILIWAVIWIVIGVLVQLFLAKGQPEVIYGVGVAAVLSLVLMFAALGGSWTGQVVEIRILHENNGDEDSASVEDITYAFVRQTNGKLRKERAARGWQVGDWLEKRKGEGWVRKL